MRLYDLPGNEFERAKGDLWEFEVDDFEFSEPCVSTAAITHVTIKPDTSDGDGIYIKDVFTWVRSGAASEMLTADYDINAWLDGDTPESAIDLSKV